ncbi:hypothetical protein D6810_01545 [Candidatus Dojkabacteria bacterium]|uniref:Uncharacterized protein n=1 Tax=Candidatus Dojkabacteria bacterium TaxID=2099670 RepID=A0A3M0Z0E6_9BACT|nr:MAG: hypothetical protein D6810_01545 [Candidatus Dojkabacteria bacterium]
MKKLILLVLSYASIFGFGWLIATSYFTVETFASACSELKQSCNRPCSSNEDTNCYIPNFDCISKRILEPSLDCCINKCREGNSGFSEEELRRFYSSFNFFGTKVNIRTDSIFGWITLGIQTYLAIVSFIALARGIKVGVIDLPKAEGLDKVSKSVINTITGFALAWGGIFIIQVILSIFGIPGLNELIVIGDQPAGSTIVIN